MSTAIATVAGSSGASSFRGTGLFELPFLSLVAGKLELPSSFRLARQFESIASSAHLRLACGKDRGLSKKNAVRRPQQPPSFATSDVNRRREGRISCGTADSTAECQPHRDEALHIGQRWQDIQGARDWDELLDPMDPLLRGELLRYGELAQATYDAFDYDQLSPYCGSCKFHESRLLEKLSLESRGYEIVKYLYATAEIPLPKFFKKSWDPWKWSKDSNWIGFVAVCTSSDEIERLGRRDIVVAWRGTVTNLEWIENTETSQCPTGVDPRRKGKGSPTCKHVDLKVENGFLNMYRSENEESRYNKTSAREQVLAAVESLVEKYKDEQTKLSITLTGHSLGGALATLCAYDIAESGINQPWTPSTIGSHGLLEAQDVPSSSDVPITVYSFGAPRVGNTAFCERLDELQVKVLRVVNLHDFVPHVPGLMFNERLTFIHSYIPKLKQFFLLKCFDEFVDSLPLTYSHAGVELVVDNSLSPFLRPTWNPMNTHNLEAYLHLLAGFTGQNRSWDSRLAVTRDVALVNKCSDFLKHDYRVPPFWWQEKNKGLIKAAHGRFVLSLRDPEDTPEVPAHDPLAPI